jgi:hypothetical protein
MTLSALGIFSAAGAGGGPVGDYELIETTILGSSQASVVFSSLGTYSSTYKHLQIRGVARSTRATFSIDSLSILFDSNGMTTYHRLFGNGSAADSNQETTSIVEISTDVATSGSFGGFVIDILDFYSTSKNKTVRALSGTISADAGGVTGKEVQLASAFRDSTSAITSVTLDPQFGANLVAGSRFSIYGIRG